MAGFGVKLYDGNEHYFAVLSPEDLSVSRKLSLPFDKGEYVRAGSCGGLLYFHGKKGKIVIVNPTTNESIVVPPPDFEPDPHEGELRASGLGYDAKSGDYKVIRHYVQTYLGKPDEDGIQSFLGYKDFFELYGFKSFGFGSWKELRRPRYNGIIYDATGVYVGETGSCYWVRSNPSYLPTYDTLFRQGTGFAGSLDSMFYHVVSFDFSTESFSRLPLPATAISLKPLYKLVGYCSSLGALAYGRAASTDSVSNVLSIELFVWKGEGRSWERVYHVVSLEDAERPVGLKDHRLFLLSKSSGGRSQLMVYDFDTKQLKKLDIYNYDYIRRVSVISFGAESTDPPLPDYIPKADYDFSRKMRTSKKAKGKKRSGKAKAKAKKRSGKGKKSHR